MHTPNQNQNLPISSHLVCLVSRVAKDGKSDNKNGLFFSKPGPKSRLSSIACTVRSTRTSPIHTIILHLDVRQTQKLQRASSFLHLAAPHWSKTASKIINRPAFPSHEPLPQSRGRGSSCLCLAPPLLSSPLSQQLQDFQLVNPPKLTL